MSFQWIHLLDPISTLSLDRRALFRRRPPRFLFNQLTFVHWWKGCLRNPTSQFHAILYLCHFVSKQASPFWCNKSIYCAGNCNTETQTFSSVRTDNMSVSSLSTPWYARARLVKHLVMSKNERALLLARLRSQSATPGACTRVSVRTYIYIQLYKRRTGRSRESRHRERAKSYSRNGTVHLILAWAMRESPLGAVHKQTLGKRNSKALPEAGWDYHRTVSLIDCAVLNRIFIHDATREFVPETTAEMRWMALDMSLGAFWIPYVCLSEAQRFAAGSTDKSCVLTLLIIQHVSNSLHAILRL